MRRASLFLGALLCALAVAGCVPANADAIARRDRRLEEGQALARRGLLAEAAEAFEDATFADPRSAEAQLLLARALLELGRTYPALDALQVADRLRPDNGPQRVLLARIYLRLGRLEEAERIAVAAAAAWPEEAQAHLALGQVRARQDRLGEAELSLTQAARLDPRLAGVQEMLGRVLLRLGRTDQAIARFQEAIEQRPCDDLAQGGLGTALVVSLQPGRARSEFSRAIECADEGQSAPWRLGLAMSLAADESWAEAAEAFPAGGAPLGPVVAAVLERRIERLAGGWRAQGCAEAVTVCAQAEQRLWAAALLLFVVGAPDAAERALGEALNLFDGDATLHWMAAQALAELGRREDARLALDRAAAWQPLEEVQAAMEALRAELAGEAEP